MEDEVWQFSKNMFPRADVGISGCNLLTSLDVTVIILNIFQLVELALRFT